MLTALLLAAFVVLAESPEASGAAPAPESPDELLRRAKEARRLADEDLARARERRTEDRKKLAAEIQKGYADLDKAGADARGALEGLRLLQADAAGAEEEELRLARCIRSAMDRTAALSGAKVDPDSPIDALESAIQERLRVRLEQVRRDLAVTVLQESVIGRSGEEHRAPVLRLGGYAAYAAGDNDETCGLLESLADGRRRVTGPRLDRQQARALREAAAGSPSRLPVDVAGTLGSRPPAARRNLWSWLAAGGMFVYPIILTGILGLVLILERTAYLVLTQAPPALAMDLVASLERKDLDGARKLLGAARTPPARVLAAGLEAAGKSKGQREAAMESALLAEVPKLERSLSLLAALAGVAPLFGLLGTVSGMISTFDTISVAGTGNPRLLSGGISEALITTELGLVVAIPLLIAHAWLSRWVERREAQLQYDAIQVFGIEERKEEA